MLQKRTLQLQTAAQVSSAATFSVLDPNDLTRQVVNLIRDRFDLHYVGLFLNDDTGKWTTLQAGAGEEGNQMMQPGYRVSVDTISPIGWSILNAQPRIILNTRLALPSLPNTRSELALPLRSRGRVIGSLTLQSAAHAAFSQEDVPVLQTMADQIAVAVDNARLFAEAQANLQEIEDIQRRYVHQQWAEFLMTRRTPIYEQAQPDTPPLKDDSIVELRQALVERKTITTEPEDGAGPAALVVPINLRGEAIGALGLQELTSRRQWSSGEIALIEAVADQMALAIENARLLEETQRRAERERLTAEITAHVRASTDVDTILRTAVREMGHVLRASEGIIHISAEQSAPSEQTEQSAPPRGANGVGQDGNPNT
jgi:GAF domain-containing protein